VVNRVEALADRPEGFIPPNAIPFKNLIPLDEIIAESKGVAKGSVAVEREYRACLSKFGTEFEILLKAGKEDLVRGLSQKIAEGVLRMREGKVNAQAGYDGEYGKISVLGEAKTSEGEKQLSLF
jgi:PHP family Zn ribbon phosphoesterase